MNRPSSLIHPVSALVACAVLGLAASSTQAQDIVPAIAQSDEQVTVWVDNAPLETFVSELAAITGRKADISGDLEGVVSGRFNGSMAETLGSVSEALPVLFELDDSTLSAIPDSEKSTATIALDESVDEQAIQATLGSDLLPGNEVQVIDGEVVVSGHPAFVNRISAEAASLMAADETTVAGVEDTDKQQSVDEEKNVVLNSEPVVDSATQPMVANDTDNASVDTQSESASRTVRWVTDIPGFDTF